MQNDLVLIAPKDSSIEPFIMEDSNSFAELTHLIWAIGDPNHVPAGKYGQQSLEYFNLYKMLEDQGIVTTANVRAALMLVELEEADLGIVYKSEAQKSDKVKVLSTFPTNTHLPIEYYCGLLDKDNENAQAFYDFLLYSTQANSLYQEYGFIPLSKED
jgi:molybdate transport system substrate-binding protein